MPSLGKLYAEITGDTKGLDKAEDRAKKAFIRIGKAATASAAIMAGAVTAAAVSIAKLTKASLATVDAQAKAAKSLKTTTASMQILQRAADLAGISEGNLNQATEQLTRRLSQAAAGTGTAVNALKRLNLSASDLLRLPLDKRIDTVNRAINRFIPATQRAAVGAELFGERGSLAISRMDSETLRIATDDVYSLGVAMTEVQAGAIESANDAMSRMNLVAAGLGNRLAADLAPALERMAGHYVEMAKEGGALRKAMDAIQDSVVKLTEKLSSQEFVEAATGAFITILDLTTKAANALIWMAENAELTAGALAALAVAALGLSGPFGIISVGAGALAALAVNARKVEEPMLEAKSAIEMAKEAQVALNKALGVFTDTGAPSAGAAAINLANDNVKLADSAYEAARAQVELRKQTAMAAIQGAIDRGATEEMFTGSIELESPQAKEVAAARKEIYKYRDSLAAAEAAERSLEEAIAKRKHAATLIAGADYSGQGGGGGIPEDEEDVAIPGLSGGGAISDQLAERLEALREGLLTEQEFLDEWREEQLATLDDALNNELITQEQYNELKERLEREHQERMQSIRQIAADSSVGIVLGAGEEVLSAMGSMNDKALQVAKVFGAAQALISTYQGAAEALKLPFPQNLAAAAAVMAKGLGLVSAIKGVGKGSSGGGSGGGGGGGGNIKREKQQRTNLNITVTNDPFGIGENLMRQLAKGLNDAQRNGTLITTTVK